jgi:hypothetical protein
LLENSQTIVSLAGGNPVQESVSSRKLSFAGPADNKWIAVLTGELPYSRQSLANREVSSLWN